MQSVAMLGEIRKLKSEHSDPVQYGLPIGEVVLPLNALLGKALSLEFMGLIHCIHCNRSIKKSYSQGYCFPCAQTLARCDFCIVRPEKCHFHLGTCREPEWGKAHCFIPHIVYMANTSGLKVGITRETQIPTRWIDQGASQALPIFKVQNRYQSGLVEMNLKEHFNDRTDWRKMLRGTGEPMDLRLVRDKILNELKPEILELENLDKEPVVNISYPVLEYPKKIQSLNLEKNPKIMGTLLGIKGQYLLFDVGVINIRNLAGYKMSVKV